MYEAVSGHDGTRLPIDPMTAADGTLAVVGLSPDGLPLVLEVSRQLAEDAQAFGPVRLMVLHEQTCARAVAA